MPLSPDHLEVLERIRAEWNQAEADIKLAEQVSNKVVWPAIKELRYAGRRVVEIIHLMLTAPENRAEIKSLLDDTLFDCYRARHDAIDVATSKISIDLELYLTKLGYDSIVPLYPEFPELWEKLQSIRDRILLSRERRHERNEIYATIEAADFGALVKQFNDLRAKQTFIEQMAKRNRRLDFYGKWGFWIGVMGFIAGSTFGIAGLLF